MGKILFCMCGLAILFFCFTFSAELWLKLSLRFKGKKGRAWLAPLIAGAVGGLTATAVFLVAAWIYTSFEPVHYFVDEILKL